VSTARPTMPDQPLRNQVAVVAGTTRWAGRGIARMLGAAGATVYCTGRSVRGQPATGTRPETIEDTAELVTEEGGRGLIVEVTDGDTLGYRGSLFYDLAKSSVIRLGYAMASVLHAHRVTALTVTPRYLRSDAVLDQWGVTEKRWRDAIAKDPYFAESETPVLSAGRSRRWPPTRRCRRNAAGCSQAGRWRRNTASPTSMADHRTGAASSPGRYGKSLTRTQPPVR